MKGAGASAGNGGRMAVRSEEDEWSRGDETTYILGEGGAVREAEPARRLVRLERAAGEEVWLERRCGWRGGWRGGVAGEEARLEMETQSGEEALERRQPGVGAGGERGFGERLERAVERGGECKHMAQSTPTHVIDVESEISCPADKMYDLLKNQLTRLPVIFPEIYKNAQIILPMRFWRWMRSDEVDDEKRAPTLSVVGGDLLKTHKRFDVRVVVNQKGTGSVVKWHIIFEKVDENDPHPDPYLEIFDNIHKKFEQHFHKARFRIEGGETLCPRKTYWEGGHKWCGGDKWAGWITTLTRVRVVVNQKGTGSVVKWRIIFEKVDENDPHPDPYLEIFDNIHKKFEQHFHK
ncbi:hypothetical protein Scep_022929 [Stephania cephalantha]|uniref:Bet v I/Major latex protein domain-containing protein n=1 Tax=Stephania cephalantha TaxID=152367 RepID=A0AAP0F8U4_9MAGN